MKKKVGEMQKKRPRETNRPRETEKDRKGISGFVFTHAPFFSDFLRAAGKLYGKEKMTGKKAKVKS